MVDAEVARGAAVAAPGGAAHASQPGDTSGPNRESDGIHAGAGGTRPGVTWGSPLPRRSLTLRLPQPLLVAVRIVVIAIVIAGLYLGRDILVPLALAVLLAFVLDPWVVRLRRWHLPRGVAVAVVTSCAVAGLAGAALLAGQQLVKEGARLPQYQSTIETKLRGLRHRLSGEGPLHSASKLIDSVGQEVDATRKALDVTHTAARTPRTPPLTVRVAEPEALSLEGLRDWAMPVLEPMLTGGIAIVLLVFILLQRSEMRDRLMHLAGGNLQQLTVALGEAAQCVSRYLSLQLALNTAYGAALALGLWALGVPGAALWGLLGATLRFVPYLGPVVASAFPLAVALAVDPGWGMLLWTAALVLTLEAITAHLVEPWLIGRSTGLAAVAIVLSAAFWTALWGPVGLVLATPLTVCLVVIGRHLPPLRSLSLLLAHEPVFDAPKRLYQRLLARNLHEAGDLARQTVAAEGLLGFYDSTAVPALGLAASERRRWARTDHRQLVAGGMAQLVDDLQRQHPPAEAGNRRATVLCLGLRGESDALAATMLAHALATQGVRAHALMAGASLSEALLAVTPNARDARDAPDARGVRDAPGAPDATPASDASGTNDEAPVICLSSFHPEPEALLRHACQRLRRLRADARIVACLWLAPPALREHGGAALGATALACGVGDAVRQVQSLMTLAASAGSLAAAPGDDIAPPAATTLAMSGA